MTTQKCDVDAFMLPFFDVFKKFKNRMGKKIMPMSLGKIFTIHYILKHNKVSMKDLSKYLEITPPSATAMIDKMEKINLVKREFDTSDRRTITISLTKKGLEMFKKAKKEKVEMMQSLLKNLTAEERETLLKILHKMLKVKTK